MIKNILRAVAVLGLSVTLFLACSPEVDYTASAVNNSRAEYGLAPLEFNAMLHLKAQAWAEQLQAQGYLSHSNLTDNNWSTTWTRLGENVGYCWNDLSQIEDLFMSSTSHRNNILGPYNKFATGVVVENTPWGTRYWVVQEFMWEHFQS